MPTWLIVGATRGIGLEFVRQLLRRGDRVLATTREVAKASQLWSLAGSSAAAACRLIECDVTREDSIIVGDAAPALQSTSNGLVEVCGRYTRHGRCEKNRLCDTQCRNLEIS